MEDRTRLTGAQIGLALLIVALAAGKIAYEMLAAQGLRQTAALFIGLPALLALILALSPRAGSLFGMLFKGITIALLMSGILLVEGFICILMAAPLFYAVALVVAIVVDQMRKRREQGGGTTMGLLLVPLALMALEGVHPALSWPRHEQVAVVRVLESSPGLVEESLARTPRFDEPLPGFLKIGFPTPISARGAGLQVGDHRTIIFETLGGERSKLELVVAERRPGYGRFQMAHDGTPMAGWSTWHSAQVEWQEAPSGEGTRVVWTLEFSRQLDPALYFAPLERLAVQLAGEYLLDTVASP